MIGSIEQMVGQVLGGTYRLDRVLGHGGMGAVFEASHTRLRSRFAVKMLYPYVAVHQDVVKRFQREALVTSELGHPNIVQVIDFNYTNTGAPYIVMELLQGADLEAVLEQERLDMRRAIAICQQVASALQAAHERGVIHRDLKPQNIFLCRRPGQEDLVKVVDFGISKVLGATTELTRGSITLGTPGYMAPEQAEGRSAEVDARSDVFSLGAILYTMLAGQQPFTGNTLPIVLYNLVNTDPRPLRELSPATPDALVQVVSRALAKKKEDRFQSASELMLGLDRALQDLEVDAVLPAPALAAGHGKPTTVSASAAEVAHEAKNTVRERRSPWLYWVLVPSLVVGLPALGAALVLLLRSAAETKPAAPPPPSLPDTSAVRSARPPHQTTIARRDAAIAPRSTDTGSASRPKTAPAARTNPPPKKSPRMPNRAKSPIDRPAPKKPPPPPPKDDWGFR